MGSHEDDRTKALLGLVREKYAPAQVVIYIDPTIPPRRLATANETVKALLDVKEDVPSYGCVKADSAGFRFSILRKLGKLCGDDR